MTDPDQPTPAQVGAARLLELQYQAEGKPVPEHVARTANPDKPPMLSSADASTELREAMDAHRGARERYQRLLAVADQARQELLAAEARERAAWAMIDRLRNAR